MRAILISIKPKYVAKILNGEKTIEVRKSKPNVDLPIDVYIYCTKDGKQRLYPVALLDKSNQVFKRAYREDKIDNRVNYLNGKVVAKFTLNKVEEITSTQKDWLCRSLFEMQMFYHFCKKGCVDELEAYKYAKGKELYAWHISNLVIFDKPKELSEFYKVGAWKVYEEQFDSSYMKRTEQEIMKSLNQTLTKAPQSWQFIEIGE